MAATASFSSAVVRPILIKNTREYKIGEIAASEYRFLSLLATLLCVLTSAPYVLGRCLHISGSVFSGVLVHSLDYDNYLAYIQQSANGAWLFRNPMTPEPHAAVFFNLEWLVGGKIAWALHVSPATAADIERIGSLCLLCFAVYWLAAHLFYSVAVRRAALIAILTGGGFGWIAAVHALHIPLDSSYFLDLTNANLFPFYWALKVPHFLVSEALLTLGLAFFVHGESSGRLRHYVIAGVCYMAAGTCRPYDMLYAMAAVSAYWLFAALARRKTTTELVLTAVPVLSCIPLLAYYYWIFKLHPIFHWWSLPGNPAPALWLLGLGYGFSLWFALYGMSRIRKLNSGTAFMMCCFVAATALTFAHHWMHFAFQFATNIFVPMLVLGFIGLEAPLTGWLRQASWSRKGLAAALVVNGLTSLALTAQIAWSVWKGDYQTDAAMLNAYSWVSDHSKPRDVVFADFNNSSQLPQYTHNFVFCGYINAVEFDKKYAQIESFLDPQIGDDFRQQLLNRYGIHFVLLTPQEYENLSSAGQGRFLREIFSNKSAVVLFDGSGSAS